MSVVAVFDSAAAPVAGSASLRAASARGPSVFCRSSGRDVEAGRAALAAADQERGRDRPDAEQRGAADLGAALGVRAPPAPREERYECDRLLHGAPWSSEVLGYFPFAYPTVMAGNGNTRPRSLDGMDTLGSILRAAAARGVRGRGAAVPGQPARAERRGPPGRDHRSGSIVFVVLTGWATVALMGRDGPTEEEFERVVVRSEQLAALPPARQRGDRVRAARGRRHRRAAGRVPGRARGGPGRRLAPRPRVPRVRPLLRRRHRARQLRGPDRPLPGHARARLRRRRRPAARAGRADAPARGGPPPRVGRARACASSGSEQRARYPSSPRRGVRAA